MRWILAASLAVISCATQAADPATIVRNTDLKAKPFLDAATLATLNENQGVNVLSRESSWYKVKATGPDGWVKLMSLRFPIAASSESGPRTGIGSNVSTSVTGAIGLSSDNLQAASPNPSALNTANSYAASKKDAQNFARSGKLVARQVKYLGE